MKLLSIFVFLGFLAPPAIAGTRFCTDTQNGDYLISLEVDSGRVVRAIYSNQDHGSADDRALAPSEYSLQGNRLSFGGDVYLCSASQEERVCDCYGLAADGHPDFLGRFSQAECAKNGGHLSGNCE